MQCSFLSASRLQVLCNSVNHVWIIVAWFRLICYITWNRKIKSKQVLVTWRSRLVPKARLIAALPENKSTFDKSLDSCGMKPIYPKQVKNVQWSAEIIFWLSQEQHWKQLLQCWPITTFWGRHTSAQWIRGVLDHVVNAMKTWFKKATHWFWNMLKTWIE